MIQSASFRPADNHTAEATTRRWLRWTLETAGDKSDVGHAAARLVAALCHLVEARGALLLSRRADSEQLWPLACHFSATKRTLVNGEFFDVDFDEEQSTQSQNAHPHCARFQSWPGRPLSADEVATDLQPFLHALGDFLTQKHASEEAASERANDAWQEIEFEGPDGSGHHGSQNARQVLAGMFSGAAQRTNELLDSDNVSSDVARSPSSITVAMQDKQTKSNGDFSRRSTPNLLLPLHDFHNEGGETSLCGLVALWLDDDAALSASQQPLLQAALVQSEGWLANAQRTERLGRSYRDLAQAMARAIDERDSGRENRSPSVAYLCDLIGHALHLDDVSIERLEFAGLLHAAGRITLPDKILHKQGALKASERDAVRKALCMGAVWFEEVDGLREVALMIRHQNERFDGSGFPDGLKGEEIPLGSRVLAIALRFAAMTQPRAQRAALPLVGGAFQNLRSEAGSALDPQIVQAFFRAMGEKESGIE